MAGTAPHRLVFTATVDDWADGNPERAEWIVECLNRHRLRDWGDLDSHDRAMNDNAVTCRMGRVMSAYDVPKPLFDRTSGRQLWVITDDIAATGTVTTVLWPSDC
jgi:hypothetical protein